MKIICLKQRLEIGNSGKVFFNKIKFGNVVVNIHQKSPKCLTLF